MTIVLVPCKRLDHGKSRLSPRLSAADREQLCGFLLRRTLGVVRATCPSWNVQVVTSDPSARKIAEDYGALDIADEGYGLNAALTCARHRIIQQSPPESVLILPIDLPFLTADHLHALTRSPTDVAIAHDLPRIGTNALFLPPDVFTSIEFSFGDESFRSHCQQAANLAGSITIFSNSPVSFDLDGYDQYVTWSQIRRNS
jgi:2-phospho-L-lactate guanylyltransferase